MGKQIKLMEAALAASIALSLALRGTEAMAFSTEPVAPPQNNAQPAPLTPFGQQLSLPGKIPEQTPADALMLSGKSGGAELTIPGIGNVGSLPKLDFGLELLYGAKGSPDALQFDQHSLDQRVPENDMQIKGTLSHKF